MPAQAAGSSVSSRLAVRPINSSLNAIKDAEFGPAQARHLLWRAGFGGTPKQINTLASWGAKKSVDYILDFDKVAFDAPALDAFDKDIMRPANAEERGEIAKARRSGDEAAVARLRAARQEAQRFDRQQIGRVQQWWLKRMIETPRPLEEKMTLFWHGLFATSYRTIEDSYHMYMQNNLFRKHAVGNYGELLFAIIRDPAMIAYLDNNDSRKDKPNENLAREIMELFSLGVGNYSEKDIKEGARALTGYTFEDDEFVFQERNHDAGGKTILGKKGNLDGDGFVKAILEHPACAQYMARRLYRFFAADYPTGRSEIDKSSETVIRQLASTLASNRYEIKPVLRRLFLSEHFYADALLNEQIKSPAELVVGAVRSLNTPVRDLGVLNDAMNLMGQNLFFPPSVKGWDGGRSWINTATMYVRQNILCFLLTGKTPQGYDPLAEKERYDPTRLLGDAGFDPQSVDASNREQLVRLAQSILELTIGRAEKRHTDTLVSYAQTRGTLDNETITGMLLLTSVMPEYQLC